MRNNQSVEMQMRRDISFTAKQRFNSQRLLQQVARYVCAGTLGLGIFISASSVSFAASTKSATVPAASVHGKFLKVNAPNKHPAIVKRIWNLQNADIHAVIDTVAKVTGRNFIVDPRVNGKMTIVSAKPMDNDAFYQAFLSMLQVLNYTTVPAGDITKIVPSMDAKQMGAPFISSGDKSNIPSDQVIVRMVPIIHTSASQLVSVIRPLMQDSSSINSYSPSNSLILAGAAGNIDKLVKMIHKLDRDHSSRVVFIPLKHGDATKIVNILQQLQNNDRSQGKVSNISYAADGNSNTILISGSPENIAQARQLIKHLDSSKGNASAVVIHLNYLDPKKFAPTLQKLATASLGTDTSSAKGTNQIAIVAEEEQNAILVDAPAAVVQQVKALVAKLDHRPGQVLVQAIIARVDNSFMTKFGVQMGQIAVDPESGSLAPGIGEAGKFMLGYDGHSLQIPGGIGAVLQALKQDTNTSILATPSVMVLNNQKADISEGQTIRVLNQTMSPVGAAASGGDPSSLFGSNYEDKQVDLELGVTPQISPNNTLQLKITQKNDTLDGALVSGQQPTIDTQKIDTNVMVHSGSILVLGGVQQNSEHHDVKKIPILGDIPVLGHLFKTNSKDHDKKSLMIFIRTQIIRNDSQSSKVSLHNYNYMQQREVDYATGKNNLSQSTVLPRVAGGDKLSLPSPF